MKRGKTVFYTKKHTSTESVVREKQTLRKLRRAWRKNRKNSVVNGVNGSENIKAKLNLSKARIWSGDKV